MAMMKAYPSFDAYLRDQPPRSRTIIRALRKFVRSVEPELTEAVKYGNGCWLAGREPVAYVYADDGFVQFGFTMGTRLRDPSGLLEGKGRFVRHIKVRTAKEINGRTFGALLRQAAKLRRPA